MCSYSLPLAVYEFHCVCVTLGGGPLTGPLTLSLNKKTLDPICYARQQTLAIYTNVVIPIYMYTFVIIKISNYFSKYHNDYTYYLEVFLKL